MFQDTSREDFTAIYQKLNNAIAQVRVVEDTLADGSINEQEAMHQLHKTWMVLASTQNAIDSLREDLAIGTSSEFIFWQRRGGQLLSRHEDDNGEPVRIRIIDISAV